MLNWFQLHMNLLSKSNEFLKKMLIKYVLLALYIDIEKNIRINIIKSPKMLTLRFFFPSVYVLPSTQPFQYIIYFLEIILFL